MSETTIKTLAAIIAVGSALSVPGWLEVRAARRDASEFIYQSNIREVEAKIVSSVKSIENPFSWGSGVPTLVAARKEMNGNYIILYSELSDKAPTQSKALVSANCSQRNFRVVTQHVYDKYISEGGYGVLGEKLPEWKLADYDAMASVLLGQQSVSAGNSILFSIACNWESYAPVSAKAAP